MKPLAILNGAADERLAETIEKYAFLNGFSTCSAREYLSAAGTRQENIVFLFVDLKGMEWIGADIVHILYMSYKVIFVPACLDELRNVREKYNCFHEVLEYPFSMNAMHYCIRKYLDREEERIYAYGRLQVDCRRRQVTLDGRELEISGFEYDIFLLLVKHMGSVVSRERINDSLPHRRRVTGRNVDTHIKNLRRQIGNTGMIRCMRSVGYYIPADYFYQEMKEEKSAEAV